jgi:hypothetical protein
MLDYFLLEGKQMTKYYIGYRVYDSTTTNIRGASKIKLVDPDNKGTSFDSLKEANAFFCLGKFSPDHYFIVKRVINETFIYYKEPKDEKYEN